ncbi:hypothetical protein B0H19DRAFT_1174495 [Mycena capillaripes]|nr:hypothetical protein B0H19DRAFT_1174495 [Mycena capillaripes]
MIPIAETTTALSHLMPPQPAVGNADTMTVTRIDAPPNVMQPHQTSSISVQMGTAVPAAWDPMATGWAGDEYTDMGSSVMMHAGSQTQYYNPDSMESTSSMMDYESESSMDDDSSTTTIYGIRIGASARATLTSSTIVHTTFSYSIFTSNSQILTTSYPVTSTEVTLVPMMTGGAGPLSSTSSRRNVGLIVGVTVSLVALLIAAIVALILWRRRRRQQRPQSLRSEASFFPDLLVSRPNSVGDWASERRLTARTSTMSFQAPNTDGNQLDRLELGGPQLQIPSALALSRFSNPGVSLRDTLAVNPATTEQGEYLASCQASIIDVPHSPTPSGSSSSSSTRQEQLASEVHMAREEISVLEKRGSAGRNVVEVGPAERRIGELYERIQELEREQAALRLEVEISMERVPPPDYVTTEG